MRLIKDIREASGLTQTELANRTKFSRKKIYNLETEKVRLSEVDLEVIASTLSSQIDLSYVAGLFDRASVISITRVRPYQSFRKSPTYIARIQFRSKYRLLCEILKSTFGVGEVCESGGGFFYYVHNKSTDTIIDKLLPFIRLKRQKLLVLREFRQFLENNRSWTIAIKQNKYAKNWQSVQEVADQLEVAQNFVYYLIQHGKLEAEKSLDLTWSIPPISNLKEVLKHKENIRGRNESLSQDMIDKYEYFYNRIREV